MSITEDSCYFVCRKGLTHSSDTTEGPKHHKENSSTTVIKIAGDGSCFYRCVAIAGTPELQTCERCLQHLPCSQEEKLFETRLADKLRSSVVSVLMANLEVVNSISATLPLLLDETVGKHYDSVAEKIEKISNGTEYSSYLEVLVVAFLLRKQFHIYQYDDVSIGSFKLMCTLPCSLYESRAPIRLLYQMDTANQPGHFDLMISTQQDQERLWTVHDGVSIPHAVTGTSHAEDELLFEHVLSDAFSSDGGKLPCLKDSASNAKGTKLFDLLPILLLLKFFIFSASRYVL